MATSPTPTRAHSCSYHRAPDQQTRRRLPLAPRVTKLALVPPGAEEQLDGRDHIAGQQTPTPLTAEAASAACEAH